MSFKHLLTRTDCRFTDGRWMPAGECRTLALNDPSVGQPLCEIARCDASDVDDAITSAKASLAGDWGAATAAERGRVLGRIGQEVRNHVDTLASMEAMDVGKPLSQARADAVALARYMEF